MEGMTGTAAALSGYIVPVSRRSRHRSLRLSAWTIQPGRCYCLTGPTGSGKTTLARILSRLEPDGTFEGELNSPVIEQGSLPVGLVLQDPEVQLLLKRRCGGCVRP